MIRSELKTIANKHGAKSQLAIAQEECAELIQAISKFNRTGSTDNLYEEIADVEIMLDQLKYIFGCELEVDFWKEKKIKRTLEKL